MAYLFGEPEDEQQKTNIFGEGQTVAAPNAQQPEAILSSSASYGSGGASGGGAGSAAGASGNGGTAAQVPSAVPQSMPGTINPSVKAQKVQSLARRQAAPDLSSYSQNLSSQEKKLQDEANSYTAGAYQNAEKQNFDQGQADKAIGGDIDAYKALSGKLSKTKADQVEAFKGLGTVDAGTEVLQDPRSQASLMRGSNAGYTGGQQAFDAMLLGRNKAFQADAKGLVDRQAALQKASDTEAIDRTKAAQDLQQSYLDIGNAQTRQYLQNSNRDLQADLMIREAQEEAKRADLNASNITGAMAPELIAQIQKDFASAAPGSIQARSMGMLNPAQDLSGYLNIDRDVDWRELVTQDEADRFNRVMGLIGDGGQSWAAGAGAGNPYSFDRAAAMDSLLGDAVTRRTAQDVEDQKAAEIAAANGGLQQQIQAYEAAKKNSPRDFLYDRVKEASVMPFEGPRRINETVLDQIPNNIEGRMAPIIDPVQEAIQQAEDYAQKMAGRAVDESKELQGRLLPRGIRKSLKL